MKANIKKILFNTFIIFIIIFCILLNKYYSIFRVSSGSMKNTINIGDYIIVKLTKDINEGDIIVYKEQNDLIVHRVIKKDNNILITKGDANNYEDEPIKIENAVGKEKMVIRYKYIKYTKLVIIIFTIITLIIKLIKGESNEK